MAARNNSGVSLTPDDLNSLDKTILDHLAREGRASPTLLMREEEIDTSRQWVSSRFVRLAEHSHIQELHDTGVYELVDDPRGSGGTPTRDDIRDQMHEWKNRWHNAHQELEGTKELLEDCREELEDACESSDVDVDEARESLRRALRDDAWGPVEDAASYLGVQTDD